MNPAPAPAPGRSTGTGPAPGSRVARKQLAAQIFGQMPRLDREVLLMRWADGLTDDEIAAVYSGVLTVGEVGTARRAAQTRFRRRFRAALVGRVT